MEARAYTNKYFSDNIGELNDEINYPIGFQASEDWLDQFLENRMREFGDYEDAIVHQELVLNHSLLFPMLNSGILTPQWYESVCRWGTDVDEALYQWQ